MSVSNTLTKLLGTWEIINGIDVDGAELLGIKLKLEESGDVSWVVKEEFKSFPLFSCDSFRLLSKHNNKELQLSACSGHVIEFIVDFHRKVDGCYSMIHLRCKHFETLQLKRISNDFFEFNPNYPISFLPALNDEYFHDVTVVASNEKGFHAHSCILQLIGIDIDWTNSPFIHLSEKVVSTLLYYLYTESLPPSIDEDTANEVMKKVSPQSCLSDIRNLCHIFLETVSVKKKIIEQIDDVHKSINLAIEGFFARCNSPSHIHWRKNFSSPDLCPVIKQMLRDMSVVFAKILLVCDRFTKSRCRLNKEDHEEIVAYVISRLPVIFGELFNFIKSLGEIFSGLTAPERRQIAIFLVPEIGKALEIIAVLVAETDKGLQQLIRILRRQISDSLLKPTWSDKSLWKVLQESELNGLRNFEYLILFLEEYLMEKERYALMPEGVKIQCVALHLDELIDEFPIASRRIEMILNSLHKLDPGKFKFSFKANTGKVANTLYLLSLHRDVLRIFLPYVCELVQREAFTDAMITLNLLPNGPTTASTSTLSVVDIFELNIPNHVQYRKFPQLCQKMFRDAQGTDMVFELRSSPHSEDTDSSNVDEICLIPAHRVIISARCEWFRKALSSGMKEDVDRKIIVYDATPFVFRVFLEYVYTGKLKLPLTAENFAELLFLSDQYQMNDLRKICEIELIDYVNEETVLYFLGVADQLNITSLQEACFAFLSENPEVTDSEGFFELPISIQKEVFTYLWCRPLDDSIPVSMDPFLEESLDTSMFNMSLSGRNSNDDERLEECILQLMEVVGPTASRSKLKEVVLAADYDATRALNFYLNLDCN